VTHAVQGLSWHLGCWHLGEFPAPEYIVDALNICVEGLWQWFSVSGYANTSTAVAPDSLLWLIKLLYGDISSWMWNQSGLFKLYFLMVTGLPFTYYFDLLAHCECRIANAETICLGLVAVTVFFTTLPLFNAAGGVLLQMAPSGTSASALNKCLRQVDLSLTHLCDLNDYCSFYSSMFSWYWGTCALCIYWCLLSASQHHVWVFPLLLERQQKLRMQIV